MTVTFLPCRYLIIILPEKSFLSNAVFPINKNQFDNNFDNTPKLTVERQGCDIGARTPVLRIGHDPYGFVAHVDRLRRGAHTVHPHWSLLRIRDAQFYLLGRIEVAADAEVDAALRMHQFAVGGNLHLQRHDQQLVLSVQLDSKRT